MKKRILLFTTVAAIALVSLVSGRNGAGSESGYNCTGAETGLSNPTGCSTTGGSCHSTVANTGITLAIELDSAGVATSSTALGTGHYRPGFTYTVKVTGTNTTAINLPKFGFQTSCIKGSAPVTTPVNAGTWGSVSGSLQITPAMAGYFVCNVVEHSTPIAVTTLTGGAGSTYVVSFPWTAPAIGTGTVSLWTTLNAVNGNDHADGADQWNTNHLVLSERDTVATVSHVGVANVANEINVNAFPNPVTTTMNLQFSSIQEGTYFIQAFDLNGRCIANEHISLNANQLATINTSNWAPGLYQVVIQSESARKIVRVVKNL